MKLIEIVSSSDKAAKKILINPEAIASIHSYESRGTHIYMNNGERFMIEESMEDLLARIEKED